MVASGVVETLAQVSESSREERVRCVPSRRQQRTGNGRAEAGTSLPTPGITTFYGDGVELILGGFRAGGCHFAQNNQTNVN